MSVAASNPITNTDPTGLMIAAEESGCTGTQAQCAKTAAQVTYLMSPVTVHIGAATITAPYPYALASALHKVYKKTYNSMGFATGPGKTAQGAPLQCATQASAMANGCSPGEQAELAVYASDVCQTRGFTCHGLGLGA